MAQLVCRHAYANNGDRFLSIDETLIHGTEEVAEDAGVLHLLPFHIGLVIDGNEVMTIEFPDLEGRNIGKADMYRPESSVSEFLVVYGQMSLTEESFLQERKDQNDAKAAKDQDADPSHHQMKHVPVHVKDEDAGKDKEEASQDEQHHPPKRGIYLDFFHWSFLTSFPHYFIFSFFPL